MWADNQPEQNQPGSDLHVTFDLDGADVISLSAADGRPLDVVALRDAVVDRSQGGVPDGTFRVLVPPAPTPRQSNSRVRATEMRRGALPGAWDLAFTGLPNMLHRVQSNTNLAEVDWMEFDQVMARPDGQFDVEHVSTNLVTQQMYRAHLP